MSATMTFPLIVGTSIQIDIVCGSRRASIKLATLCGPFFKRVAEICIWLSLKFYALLQDAGTPVHKEIKPPARLVGCKYPQMHLGGILTPLHCGGISVVGPHPALLSS